jgi:hypothetical protein
MFLIFSIFTIFLFLKKNYRKIKTNKRKNYVNIKILLSIKKIISM